MFGWSASGIPLPSFWATRTNHIQSVGLEVKGCPAETRPGLFGDDRPVGPKPVNPPEPPDEECKFGQMLARLQRMHIVSNSPGTCTAALPRIQGISPTLSPQAGLGVAEPLVCLKVLNN